MKKQTKVLLISVWILFGIFVLTKGVSYAKYASNSAWNYYLESKDFYFSSDYLSINGMENINNNWDLSDIEFNIKNSENDILATEYDINYKVTCTTNNDKVSCNLNNTNKNEYTGVLSTVKKCVNEIDETNVSSLDNTECELGGYEWKSVISTQKIHFNLTSDEEYENVTVNINVSSTGPYKKTLLGTFKLTKDKSISGMIDSNYFNYDNYDRLVISNTHSNVKCAKVIFDSSKLRIETPLNNVKSYEKDNSGYINSIIVQISPKENLSFKFYKQDSNIYTKEDFTIIESDC